MVNDSLEYEDKSVAEWLALKARLNKYPLSKEQCENRYKYHLDDGGFLIGFCARCGFTADTGGVGAP